jgi:phenylalanyl-tRNA synthetase beta chain
MKVTLNWLKQYVDFDWSPEELSDRLTMLGIEVEGVQKLGGEFAGIVVAQVITRDKHPNADKLSLCRVNDGKGERQIVCGAQNFKAGDKVPLILPGASLPAKPGEQPFTIKVGKIRGIESQGMMCSPDELGLPDKIDGLLILREDATVGQPFAEYLGRSGNDVVYDLEITPNRPDLNSVVGIAREISALTAHPLKLPNVQFTESAECADALVAVKIESPELCPRYTARVVRGVKVGPSPDWLKGMLEKVGIRSINNIVDVTNYVMLEIGQPLHAFDYHLLAKPPGDAIPTIVVRNAPAGEKFTTLDGQERTLTENMLLIADKTQAVALAGVMGGKNSEINAGTVDVLIESACFKPQNIRATSKKLELRSEASYRFERGADVGICDWAARRAAQLIQQTAGGTVAAGAVDSYPGLHEPKLIALRHPQADALMGVTVPMDQQVEYLQRLGLEVATAAGIAPSTGIRTPHSTVFRIPSFRVDLKTEIDLIEEVCRLYGVDKIPSTPPKGAIGSNAFDAMHDEIAEARRILAGLGLYEAQGQTLISDTSARLAAGDAQTPLRNPLSSDMNVLRPSLLPGLLDSLRNNVRHQTLNVALFEIGRVFNVAARKGQKAEDASGTQEGRRIAIALTGSRHPLFWTGDGRDAKMDVYDLKGLVEEFFDQFGVRGMTFNRKDTPVPLYLESATINLGHMQLGEIGQLSPVLAKRYDLRDAVFLAELNLNVLLNRRNSTKSFRALPAFPAIRRDIAMSIPEATTHDAVVQAVKQAKPANLEAIELFDVFRGKGIPEGQKSVAYAFTYRQAERTLTDAEVNSAHEKLVEQLKQKLQAVIR